MPDAFKDLFNPAAVRGLAHRLAAAWPAFPENAFVSGFVNEYERLEMKARWALVTRLLDRHLPEDFATGRRVLHEVVAGWPARHALDAHGFLIAPLLDWIAGHGLAEFDTALGELAFMTKRFSAEFAVRPFFAADAARALAHARRWTAAADPAVRRLASEGTRPRLPWGSRLQVFQENPGLTVALLERLKDDPDQVVRRSVANHLNDIAKDHPDTAAALFATWWKNASSERQALVRHAARTLLKAGHPVILALFGYGAGDAVRVEALAPHPACVPAGGSVTLAWDLENGGTAGIELVLDIRISFPKAGGKTSAKVWKGTTCRLAAGEQKRFSYEFSFRPVSVRTYHPGRHEAVLLVNGRPAGACAWELAAAQADAPSAHTDRKK